MKMKNHKNRHSVLPKAVAMVVVCLFLVNDIVWAYPDNVSQNSTLARWSAVQVLSNNSVNDPMKVMLEAVTGIEFLARGKPARVVNSMLTKSAHAVGTQRKIRFLEDMQRADDVTCARFEIVGEENKVFEITLQKDAIVVRRHEPVSAQLPARVSNTGLARAANEEEPLYQAIRKILPELPEYYPLDQRYSTGSDSRIRSPVKRDTQVEYTAEGETRTNRYADFFDIMNSPGHWPESNLTKDRLMADWLNRLVSLNGKTVVHYRSEYYPFFGLKAAEYGATSYLVDPRKIPYVEDLLLGRKKFSRKAYLQAEEATRQISPMSEAVSKYTEELLKLPPKQLIELIVKTEFNIPDHIWDGLTKIERNYYILKWIKDNPGFSLSAARYFSNKVFQRPGHEEKNSWWSLSKEEQLPYLLEYIGQNFLWAIRENANRTALAILRRKSLDSLPEELGFSYAAGDIYGRVISNRINWSINQDTEFDRRWYEVLNEELFFSRSGWTG